MRCSRTSSRRRRAAPPPPPGAAVAHRGVLGLTFGAMSVTPSLVPRAWFLQSLVTGLCVVTGYGLGAFVGWAYRTLRLPDLPDRARSVAWKALAALAVVVLLVGGWLGWRWQSEQRELLGMDTSVPLVWLVAPLLGLLVAALLLGIGRAVKALGRAVFRPLGRVLPVRVAWLLAIVVTVVVTYLVFSGLLIGTSIYRRGLDLREQQRRRQARSRQPAGRDTGTGGPDVGSHLGEHRARGPGVRRAGPHGQRDRRGGG